MWAEIQRERERKRRAELQAQRAAARAAEQTQRQRERAERERRRQEAADAKERRRLYIEQRKAAAEAMTAEARERMTELDALLRNSVHIPSHISFSSLKPTVDLLPFDPQGLDRPVPAPEWKDFAPSSPSGLSRLFGGRGKFERQRQAAEEEYRRRCARHATDEQERQQQLEEKRRAHEQKIKKRQEEVEARNAEVDQFERDFHAGEPEAVRQYFDLVLAASSYPNGFPQQFKLVYRPEPRELLIEYELPNQDVVPTEREFRYVQKRDTIEPVARAAKEVKQCYSSVLAQVALRTLREVFDAGSEALVDAVVFNGRVSAKDRATGQPIHPCLVSINATREGVSALNLAEPELDPVLCLQYLNALVSPHPYDLEGIRPVKEFDLSKYRLVEGMDAMADLDSRPDLLDMTPTEFEHLVRQLFEAIGMQSWTTQASRDDGVDAVAINNDPIMGGECIIQAKRYRGAVEVDAARALAGVMDDKRATTGVLVTTSWVSKGGRDFAIRNGRIQIIEGSELKYLLNEHLDLDVLISTSKRPPSRN